MLFMSSSLTMLLKSFISLLIFCLFILLVTQDCWHLQFKCEFVYFIFSFSNFCFMYLKTLLMGTYTLSLLCCIFIIRKPPVLSLVLFMIMTCTSLSLVIFFALKSTNINMVNPAFFYLICAYLLFYY